MNGERTERAGRWSARAGMAAGVALLAACAEVPSAPMVDSGAQSAAVACAGERGGDYGTCLDRAVAGKRPTGGGMGTPAVGDAGRTAPPVTGDAR